MPCLGTKTQMDASARLGEVALNDRESEAAMNQAIVSDERDNLRRSRLKSTPVFVHHGSALREMNISGNQVLVALAIAFCLEKAFADLDPVWGQGIINSDQRIQIVYLTL